MKILTFALFMFVSVTSSFALANLDRDSCGYVSANGDLSRVKYVMCFNQRILAQLDFSQTGLAGAEFQNIPLKVKSCSQQNAVGRVYGMGTKVVGADGWKTSMTKIDHPITQGSDGVITFWVKKGDTRVFSTLNANGGGSGNCYFYERPYKTECTPVLNCNEIPFPIPECACSWPSES